MSKENSSTVLSEHSKIFSVRHILAIVNFLIILACTVVTIVLSSRKGAPVGIQVFLYLLMCVNIGQIGICIADYVLKQYYGFYTKWLTIASYIVGGLWLIMMIGELIAGCVAFKLLRTDLLVISIVQFVVAFAVYIVWPYLERKSLDAFVRPSVRGDQAKRISKFRAFVGTYIGFCAALALVQVFALFLYRMPPKLYDLFSDTRAIEYTPVDDGYVVTKVYTGTSSKVNIPATYNNKPVLGIAGGAIDDSELIEKYRVSEITIGSAEKDADGNDVTVSYLKFIESGAINNDKIESLIIPESVEEIGVGAINSNSLKTLQYEAKADFAFSYLNCGSLANVRMAGDSVGRLVSIEGKNSNCEIEVSKDIYNAYRQDNPDYMSYFVPILDDGEFCIDFYTDCDYYIDSIISSGNMVELKYSDLSNPKMTGVAPSVDTLAYIRNNHELGTNGAKADSAFRGWYYDKNFTEPCTFGESSPVRISRSVSIYAKWIDEYNATLNWGTYQPQSTADKLYWSDEDEKILPVVTNRTGYSAGIQWLTSDTGKVVTTTKGISRNLNFNGSWQLDAPDISILLNYNTSDPDFQVSRQQDNVTFTYDENRSLPLVAVCGHSMGKSGIDYAYYWMKTGGESSNLNKVDASKDSFGANIHDMDITVRNVRQTGIYTLYVTATAIGYGEKSTSETSVTVTINKKDLDIGSVYYAPSYEYTYNATNRYRVVESSIPGDVKPEYLYTDNATGATTDEQHGIINTGTYTVSATFSKIDADERSNYNTKVISTVVTIKPAPLTYVGWYLDDERWTDTTVYDSAVHSYSLKVDGALSNDNVNVLYESVGHSASDAGKYTAKVSGVDNDNYTLNEINQANLNHEWSITQRTVTVLRWQVNGSLSASQSNTFVYDGTEHSVSAIMNGKISGDDVDFVYDSRSAFVMKATNAGNYKALILGVDNDNYYYDAAAANSLAEYDWSITRREIVAEFQTPSSEMYYNGGEQGITAVITNIAHSDVSRFSYDMFDFAGSSGALSYRSTRDTLNDKLTISFTAVNANTSSAAYTAKINGLASESSQPILENYKLVFSGGADAGITQSFTINPKTISFVCAEDYVYNGQNQELKLLVSGLESKDVVAGIDFDLFATTALGGSASGGNYYLVYSGRDADSYPVSVTAFANTNYTMSAYTSSISIARKQLSLSDWMIRDDSSPTAETVRLLPNDAKSYNFNGYTVSAVVDGIVSGDETLINYGLEYTKNSNSQADSYTTTVSLGESEFKNYSFDTHSISWEITPYVIKDLTWNISGVSGTGVVYDGTVKNLGYEFTRLGNDTVALVYSNSTVESAVNAGSYKVSVLRTNNTNYVLTSTEFSWQITPAVLRVNWNASPAFIYSGQYQAPSFSLEGLAVADADKLGDMTVGISYSGSGVTYYGNVSGTKSQTLNSANNYLFNGSATGFAVDAGSYVMTVTEVITVSGSSEYNNYTITSSTASKAFTIGTKTISLSGQWYYSNPALNLPANTVYSDSARIVYNSNNYTFTTALAAGGLVSRLGGSTDNVTLTYDGNIHSEAGDYTAEVTGLSGTYADNYSLAAAGSVLDWQVERKVLKFNWRIGTETNTTVYTSSQQTISAYTDTVSAVSADFDDGKLISGSPLNIAYTDNVQVNAGTYTAKITALNNDNYTWNDSSNASCIWTIKPKAVDISWDYSSAYVYNGRVQHPEARYGTGVDSLTAGITYSGDTAVKNYSASGYRITVSGIDNPNYTLTGGTNLSCDYSINQRPVTINWTVGTEGASSYTSTGVNGWSYDGKTRTVNAIVSNACEGDLFTFTYSGDTTSGRQFKNVGGGSYSLTVSGVGNTNYTLNGGSNLSTSFTVTKRVVTLSWQRDNTTVTGNTSVVYDGNAHALTASVSNLCTGDSVAVTYSGATSWTNASTTAYSVTVNGLSDGSNYTISGASSLTRTLTINAQPVAISWSGTATLTYDGNPHSLTATVRGQNDGKAVGFNYGTSGNTATNSGSHTITVSSLSDTNYTLGSVVKTATLTINPKAVGILWTNYSGTYDGKSHSATATVTGAVNGETVTVTAYSGNAKTNAGYYEVTATALSSSNYVLSDGEGGIISIAQQKVAISWTVDGAAYSAATGTIVYDGNAHTLSASVTGADDGNSLNKNYVSLTNSITNAGTLTVTVDSLASSNYTLAGCTGDTSKTLTISKKSVSVSWNNATETYDGNNHYLVPVFTGFISSQHSQSVVYSINNGSVTSSGNSAVNAGTYTVRIVSLGNDNYSLASSGSGTLVIEKQSVQISWYTNDGYGQHDDISQYTYNGGNQTLQVSIRGLYTSENLNNAVTVTVRKGNSLVSSVVDAGTYTYTVSGLTNSNYTLDGATVSTTQTVNAATVTVEWEEEITANAYLITARVYNENIGEYVAVRYYSVDGGGNSIYASVSVNNSGEHTVTVTELANSNYTLAGARNTVYKFTI